MAKLSSVVSRVTAKLGQLGQLIDKFMVFQQKWADKLVKAGEKMKVTKGGDVIAGALYKGIGTEAQLGATGRAAVDALKTSGKTAVEEGTKAVTGVKPGSHEKSPFHTVKAGIDITKKVDEHASTVEQGQIGGSPDAD